MTELVKGSTGLFEDAAAVYAASLLRHYSFELGEYSVQQLLTYWLASYSIDWVRLAIVEALYQGRYKAFSVEQILVLWQRRGEPLYHFNHEFERLVCENLPRDLSASIEPNLGEGAHKVPPLKSGYFYRRIPYEPPGSEVASSPSVRAEPSLPELYRTQEETAIRAEPVQPLPDQQTFHPVDGDRAQAEDVQWPLADAPVPAISIAEKEAPGHEDAEANPVSVDAELKSEPSEIDPNSLQKEPSTENSNQPTQPTTLPEAEPKRVMENQTEQNPASTQPLLSSSEAELILPSIGLGDKSLKPKLRLHLSKLYQPNWLMGSIRKHPIDQFTPISNVSDFYSKLKAVANPTEEPPRSD